MNEMYEVQFSVIKPDGLRMAYAMVMYIIIIFVLMGAIRLSLILIVWVMAYRITAKLSSL